MSPLSTTNNLGAVIFARDMFVVVGAGGTIMTSGDGITWTNQNSGTVGDLSRIAYGGGQLVVMGRLNDKGVILNSPDGIQWMTNPLNTFPPITGLAYGNGQFIFVTEPGSVWTSSDGINWVLQQNLFFYAPLTGLAYANDSFVVLTYGSDLLKLADGTNWVDSGNIIRYLSLNGITYGKNQLAAVGYTGASDRAIITTSPDGTNWTRRATEFSGPVFQITSGGGYFVATGSAASASGPAPVITSTDGVIWTGRNPANIGYAASAGFGNNRFVITGRGGAILFSDLVSDAQPVLSSISSKPEGVVQMSVKGPIGRQHLLQGSTDFINWETVTNFSTSAQSTSVRDPASATLPMRFYRAVVP